jgi:hypothetical protein
MFHKPRLCDVGLFSLIEMRLGDCEPPSFCKSRESWSKNALPPIAKKHSLRLSIIAFGNHGYPHAIKSIREEKNSLSLRQFFFVCRINLILFGSIQREEGNQDQSQKHVNNTEQQINDLLLCGCRLPGNYCN